jgi:lysophospholipase L1-like esterase
MQSIHSTVRAAVGAALLLTSLSAGTALAQSAPAAVAQAASADIFVRTPCNTPKALGRLQTALPTVARKLLLNEGVTIVALGSSSTAGAGASSPAFSYPSRLVDDLKKQYPHAAFNMINRGVNGEEVKEMLARLDTILADKPALVIWQMGTNSVLRDQDAGAAMELAMQGIARIKAAGADVLLVDLQYAPRVLAKSETNEMLSLIEEVGRVERVPVFNRFAVMRHWHDQQQLAFDTFITPDGLHLNDWGYACFARTLAEAMSDSITRGQAMAIAAPPRR